MPRVKSIKRHCLLQPERQRLACQLQHAMGKKSRRAIRQTRREESLSVPGRPVYGCPVVVCKKGELHYDTENSEYDGNWWEDPQLCVIPSFCNPDLKELLDDTFFYSDEMSESGHLELFVKPHAVHGFYKVVEECVDTNLYLPHSPDQEMIEGEYAARHFLHDLHLRSRILREIYTVMVKDAMKVSTIKDEAERIIKTRKSFERKSGICAACGKFAWERCSGCMNVHYCTKVCQKRHWAEHKSVCKKEN